MNHGIRIEWRVSEGVSNCKQLLESGSRIVVASAEHHWSPSTNNRGIRIEEQINLVFRVSTERRSPRHTGCVASGVEG